METRREEGKEYVLKMAKEHDVKFIRLWFTDILGFLKSHPFLRLHLPLLGSLLGMKSL